VRLLQAAQELPEVEHAAALESVPFWSTTGGRLFVEGIDSVQRLGRITSQRATADYFPTMGTRILRGRAFGREDRAGAPLVAVISQGLAHALWPGRDALGQCMRVGADTMPCTTVIGISEDAVQTSLTDRQRFRYYLPLEQIRPDPERFHDAPYAWQSIDSDGSGSRCLAAHHAGPGVRHCMADGHNPA
jgi:hypothetical protein